MLGWRWNLVISERRSQIRVIFHHSSRSTFTSFSCAPYFLFGCRQSSTTTWMGGDLSQTVHLGTQSQTYVTRSWGGESYRYHLNCCKITQLNLLARLLARGDKVMCVASVYHKTQFLHQLPFKFWIIDGALNLNIHSKNNVEATSSAVRFGSVYA